VTAKGDNQKEAPFEKGRGRLLFLTKITNRWSTLPTGEVVGRENPYEHTSKGQPTSQGGADFHKAIKKMVANEQSGGKVRGGKGGQGGDSFNSAAAEKSEKPSRNAEESEGITQEEKIEENQFKSATR